MHIELAELHYRISPSPDDVFLKQFLDDKLEVGDVDLVDETVNALLQGFPGDSLIGLTVTNRSTKLNIHYTTTKSHQIQSFLTC